MGGLKTGNDQIAFRAPRPVTTTDRLIKPAVTCRIPGKRRHQLERMGVGLVLNGAYRPRYRLFANANPSYLAECDRSHCRAATRPRAQEIGPEVFRLEYYYLVSCNPSIVKSPSVGLEQRSVVNGLRSVAAIVVAIAVIDPRSKVLLSNPNIATRSGIRRVRTLLDSAPTRTRRVSSLTKGRLTLLTHPIRTAVLQSQLATPGHFRYSAVRTLFLSYQ